MTRLPPYSDPFWEKDASSGSAGFDALKRRCKEGRNTLDEMEEFVRARSKVEEDYGRALVKLSKTAPLKDEFGTLRSAWERQRQQTDRVGRLHTDMSVELCHLADRLRLYATGLSEQRKKASEAVKKCQALKAEMEKKSPASDAKKNRARDSFNESTAAADEGHYESVENCCDAVRSEWLTQMDATCQLFELMETERGEYVRKQLWLMTNVDSVTCLERDLANDQTRTALQRCSPDDDLKLFISRRRPQEQAEQPSSPSRSAAAGSTKLSEGFIRELTTRVAKTASVEPTPTPAPSYQHTAMPSTATASAFAYPSTDPAAGAKRRASENPVYEDVDLKDDGTYFTVEAIAERPGTTAATTTAAAGGRRVSNGSADLTAEPEPPWPRSSGAAASDGRVRRGSLELQPRHPLSGEDRGAAATESAAAADPSAAQRGDSTMAVVGSG